MDGFRITVLAENTAGVRALLAEHGWSVLLEIRGRRYLFDTGQGLVLVPNARALGQDLGHLDAVLLSHGHYDHAGGLAAVLARNPGLRLYAHPEAFTPKFARNADGTARPVGLDDEQLAAARTATRMPVEGFLAIDGGVFLTGPIPRKTDFEDTGGAFFLDRECTRPDRLPDDQAVFFETPAGLVVILGCAHAGVVNTLLAIREYTGGKPIHTLIGGMHLVHADDNRLERTLEAFRELDIQRLFPCHCTGFAAMARMWNAFPERCFAVKTGLVLEGTTRELPGEVKKLN
jgi:7,8-dihydropterin-6-yl-methyl-4-(beta-D-ribofuranosyl)aminobenzene 5'-phosphate synthase